MAKHTHSHFSLNAMVALALIAGVTGGTAMQVTAQVGGWSWDYPSIFTPALDPAMDEHPAAPEPNSADFGILCNWFGWCDEEPVGDPIPLDDVDPGYGAPAAGYIDPGYVDPYSFPPVVAPPTFNDVLPSQNFYQQPVARPAAPQEAYPPVRQEPAQSVSITPSADEWVAYPWLNTPMSPVERPQDTGVPWATFQKGTTDVMFVNPTGKDPIGIQSLQQQAQTWEQTKALQQYLENFSQQQQERVQWQKDTSDFVPWWGSDDGAGNDLVEPIFTGHNAAGTCYDSIDNFPTNIAKDAQDASCYINGVFHPEYTEGATAASGNCGDLSDNDRDGEMDEQDESCLDSQRTYHPNFMEQSKNFLPST